MPDELNPCWTALMDYQQADADGVMVLVSRQAIHECFKDYLKRGAELNRLAEPSVQEATRVLNRHPPEPSRRRHLDRPEQEE